MGDPPIVTGTFCPNQHNFLFIDIQWPPKPLVFYTKVKKVSHSGNPTKSPTRGTYMSQLLYDGDIMRLLLIRSTSQNRKIIPKRPEATKYRDTPSSTA